MKSITFVFFFLWLLVVDANANSPVTCTSPGVECEYTEENYIDTETEVYSEEECRQICMDQEDCQFITYFDSSATPISYLCRTFKTCEKVVECDNCVSQNIVCFNKPWPCGSNFVGRMEENIVDVVMGVTSEQECKQLCSDHPECSWFTFFFSFDSQNHDTCFLQTELHLPLETSTSAFSGPSDCSNDFCSLIDDGQRSTSLIVNDTHTHNLYIPAWTSDSSDTRSCQLRVLAIGGGGRSYGPGGGSGYIQYQTLELSQGLTTVSTKVETFGYDTVVNINGETVITAKHGGSGEDQGGDGYSGGGMQGGCDGGSGGSDGECGLGGAGTGEDISHYTFKSFTLSPGAGGEYYVSHSYYYGGGGGGVLVNGWGPEADPGVGQGYGGGDGGDGMHGGDGLQGVILLEVVSN